jgi:hypothetical protein
MMLSPATWLWSKVLEKRKGVDPMEVLLLRCVLEDDPEDWAEYLRIFSNGRFKSQSFKSERGTISRVLSVCDDLNVWKEDLGGEEYRKLFKRVLFQVFDLAGSDDLQALFSQADVSEAVKGRFTKACDGKTYNELTDDQVHDQVKWLCTVYNPDHRKKTLPKGLKGTFEDKVLDNEFEFDAKRLWAFSDGLCYDAEKKIKRTVLPEDGVTRSYVLKYPYPELDDAEYKELDGYFSEITPDKDTREWKVARYAKHLGLESNSTSPFVEMSYGPGGSGKSLTCELIMKAFGPRALNPDVALFVQHKTDNAEAPKSARLKLKGKAFVWGDEVPQLSGGLIKNFVGGCGDMHARGMKQNDTEFKKLFFLILTYNLQDDAKDDLKLKKDSGLGRRVYGVKAENRLLYCNSPEEAKARELEWEKEDLEEELKKHTKQAEKDDVKATWHEVWPTRPRNRYTMYTEKHDRIMELSPQLMAKMIEIHRTGNYGPYYESGPLKVQEWTAEMWAGAAPVNPLDRKMGEWYNRCPCTLKENPQASDNLNLVDADGKACTHYIQGSDLNRKLKACSLDNGFTLYKSLKGESKKDDAIYAMLAKVRMGGVSLKKKIVANTPVIPGLVPKGICSVAAAAGVAPTSPTASSASAP